MSNHIPLRTQIPLRYRKIIKKSFGKFIVLAIPSAIVLFLYFAGLDALREGEDGTFRNFVLTHEQNISLMVVGFFAVLILWYPIWEWLYFITYYYEMDDNNVVIRKGVIAKREITLPFSKITDVYVDQDLLDVVLGLFDVHISTPTVESGRFAHIDGVDRAGSKKLRQLILERVNVDTDDK